MRSALIFFALMVAAQWFVPWNSIRGNERVLREGRSFNFRTAPIDPHDPFRGEYVTLRYDIEAKQLYADPAENWHQVHHAYIVLKTVDGYAAIDRLEKEEPNADVPYLNCTIDAWNMTDDSTMINVDLPFDRYYLEEGRGRRTEQLMVESMDDTTREMDAYVTVRVLEGEGVIEELVIGGKPLREWMD
ncbi:MAG: GDYXXLXY domain-containing protein [Flavobacteriales bacterium]|nr:GDYXXLXY domain-containing protein [Flavobacteriales bacterium]